MPIYITIIALCAFTYILVENMLTHTDSYMSIKIVNVISSYNSFT